MAYKTKIGVLLVNLGTPSAPTRRAVRRYLREFLSDPCVVDLPNPLRWLLVNGLILPFRVSNTTNLYRAIWTEKGSPLLVIGQELQQQLTNTLDNDFHVELAMRYGELNIANALKALLQAHCEPVIVLPLFPQYAKATTGSIVNKVTELYNQQAAKPALQIITDFFDNKHYINALADTVKPVLQDAKPDILLMSYHGLPMQHIASVEERNAPICMDAAPCGVVAANNRFCYRAQCYATSRLLAEKLALGCKQFRVSFQSRLGRLPWIQPETTQVLSDLAQQGCKHLAVVCPSFVADCLETLEEINIRARQQWQALGGVSFTLIPCLNAQQAWVQALATMIQDHALPSLQEKSLRA